jgi:hypothetical protein
MKGLGDVPAGKVWQGQQAALMRLQLFLMGRTHEAMGEMGKGIRDALLRNANGEGKLDGLGLWRAKGELERVWTEGFDEWKGEVEALRWEAASIPFGTLARLHEVWLGETRRYGDAETRGHGDTETRRYGDTETRGHGDMETRRRGDTETRGHGDTGTRGLGEATGEEGAGGGFGPQVTGVVDAASARVYGDGLNWSGRVWNLDRESLAGIQREVYAGVANGDSAWEVSKRIEQYLGAGEECPRWTRTRLYSLTKKDIASGDRTGLYSGDECAGQGVAYKALRLARNEIQIAHHMATDAVMQRMPWVLKEKVELSPAHPEADVCDDVAGGGDKGDGVYEKGTIAMPLHVQCSPAGQTVKSPLGDKDIADVSVGDSVLTHHGRFCKVTKTMSRLHSGFLVRMTTRSGRVVLLTPDHPVLVNGIWKAIGDVKPGESVEIQE